MKIKCHFPPCNNEHYREKKRKSKAHLQTQQKNKKRTYIYIYKRLIQSTIINLLKITRTRGVSHCGHGIYIKKYFKAKD